MEHFFKALRYSRDGFLTLLKERSFRQELVLVCAGLLALACLRGARGLLDAAPWGILVLIAEALNTGVERAVDLCTQEWRRLAKEAKDCASFACGAAITAFIVVCARTVLF